MQNKRDLKDGEEIRTFKTRTTLTSEKYENSKTLEFIKITQSNNIKLLIKNPILKKTKIKHKSKLEYEQKK